MTRLLLPAMNPQPPIPAGTYGPARTALVAGGRHALHHAACWPPVVLAAAVPLLWPLLPAVFVSATLRHHEDWRRALRSVSDALGAGAR